MRNFLLFIALVAGLILPVGAAHAQSTPRVTATCKDGTAFTSTKRSGACRGHGGVQSWGEASTATSPLATPAPTTSSNQPAHHSEARWRPWASLGEYRHQCLSLPERSLVRQDQARQLHV
jgi:hypothetical protein